MIGVYVNEECLVLFLFFTKYFKSHHVHAFKAIVNIDL